MELGLIVGPLLALSGAWCAVRAYVIDRELRRLIPPSVERSWQRRSLLERPLAESIIPIDFYLPARWQRHLHSDRGIVLLDRFYTLVCLAWCLYVPGVMIISESIN